MSPLAARHPGPRRSLRPDWPPRPGCHPAPRRPPVVSIESSPVVEQLGERVLEQRQGVGLTADLVDQRRQQATLERDPDPRRRPERSRFELIGGQRHDVDDMARHQPTERRVQQGTVVEVGSQRHQHPAATPRIGRQRDEAATGSGRAARRRPARTAPRTGRSPAAAATRRREGCLNTARSTSDSWLHRSASRPAARRRPGPAPLRAR